MRAKVGLYRCASCGWEAMALRALPRPCCERFLHKLTFDAQLEALVGGDSSDVVRALRRL